MCSVKLPNLNLKESISHFIDFFLSASDVSKERVPMNVSKERVKFKHFLVNISNSTKKN